MSENKTTASAAPASAVAVPLVCVSDYTLAARARLPPPVLIYYSEGATDQQTLRENSDAMNRWYILPRMMRDVSRRDMRTTLLGHKVLMPVGVSPTAMQKMAHPTGECATAAAAGRHGTIFTLSTISNTSIEEVAQHAPDTCKFFQVYIYKDRTITEQLVRRAVSAGFKAIVLTIDSPCRGVRRDTARLNFTLPPHLKMANFEPISAEGNVDTRSEESSGNKNALRTIFDESVTWEDLKWLIRLSSVPVITKGVLTAEDARLAVEAGVGAVWVSNHGGRQVDSTPPTIEALPHIAAEVGGRCPVLVDGGFAQGTDVYKALALGAHMVFIGRPVLWGLAVNGEDGVFDVLDIIKKELDNLMANTGCCTLKDINQSMVVRKELYPRMRDVRT